MRLAVLLQLSKRAVLLTPAALGSLAPFGAFGIRAHVEQLDVLNFRVFTGLLFGAMMPYAIAAWTMVDETANDMVVGCNRQSPQTATRLQRQTLQVFIVG